MSGARVLISDECMKIVQEREDAKKERPFNYKKERKREKQKNKEISKHGKSKQNKGTPLSTKGKGKQKVEVNEI